jgi:hypothetical protein
MNVVDDGLYGTLNTNGNNDGINKKNQIRDKCFMRFINI